MPAAVEPLHVGALPRVPFLAHSEELLQLLLSYGPAACQRALEIGCGPRSPLLPMLRRRWPDVDVHQIDARPDFVAEAAKNHPGGKVEQMLAWDMAAIPDESKQLVIAMSVFDQNTDLMLSRIASEVRRVLTPDGVVVYIHNEELNLPATAVSLLNRSSGRTLVLPNNHWQPTNDLEYCSGARDEIDAGLAKIGADAAPLQQYLLAVYPQIYANPPAEFTDWKISASFIREFTLPVFSRIRHSVAILREQAGVRLVDHRTTDLLRSHIEGEILNEKHGFRIARAGIFEMRRSLPWQKYFEDRPPATHFVRSTIRFGYTAASAPPPAAEFEQDLNDNHPLQENEVMFIAHQYGVVARKT